MIAAGLSAMATPALAQTTAAPAESVQIEPDQLDLVLAGGPSAPWAQALTVGYERTIVTRRGLQLFAGASYTQDFVPGDFRPAYGADPRGGKAFLRFQYAIGAGGG